jgi:hypothetical protein
MRAVGTGSRSHTTFARWRHSFELEVSAMGSWCKKVSKRVKGVL